VKVERVDVVAGLGGAWCDDRAAIQAGAEPDGFIYRGEPVTPGFAAVRVPGGCLSVLLTLEDGSFAVGDCTSVTYAGHAGRDPLLATDEAAARRLQVLLAERLVGLEVTRFREKAASADGWEGDPLLRHAGVRYGISSALLSAVALATRRLPVQVLVEEYGLLAAREPVPLFVQTGDDRYLGADRAILKRADGLPHGLFNTLDKLGPRGQGLLEYCDWLRRRVQALGGSDYRPFLQFDVYGTIGLCFALDAAAMADYLTSLARSAHPYELRVEGVLEGRSRPEHIDLMAELRRRLQEQGIPVKLVADEWCNTLADVEEFARAGAADYLQIKMPDLGSLARSVEAVLSCQQAGVGAYLGGSCNETDVSARLTVHVALATRADYMLVKPGFGIDEGLMLMRNEMLRTLKFLSGPQ
jgi:methylaspartate ammonia-lyase